MQVSTKLNRSHVVTGRRAIILPTLGRTDRDRRGGGEQRVTVEDSMGAVHASRGRLVAAVRGPAQRGRDRRAAVRAAVRDGCRRPAGSRDRRRHGRRGRPRPGRATGQLDDRGRSVREPDAAGDAGLRHPLNVPQADWAALEHDYALIRQHIAAVIPGFEDFEASIDKGRTLFLPNGPRDERRFATADGKARFTVNPLEYPRIPRGRLLLQTLRSHDQYNTTIYGKDDRYRGIHGGRRVVMVNPKDIQVLGFAEGEIVDLVSEWAGADGVMQERRAEAFRIVGVLARRAATPPPTIPRRTCSCRSTRSPTSAARRPRSRSSSGSSAADA